MSTPISVIASITAGLISLARARCRGANVDAPLRAELDQAAAIWRAPGVVHADEQHLGLLLRDRALGLAERLQALAGEAVDEHRHEDVDLRAAEQVGRLGDVAGDRLLREDARELALERLGGPLDVVARDGIENVELLCSSGSSSSTAIDARMMTRSSIAVNMFRMQPIATIAASCPPLLQGALAPDEAQRLAQAR